VLTQKNAIEGWEKFIVGNERLKHSYDVFNYEKVSKITKKYDLVIIDESHNIGAFPKPSQRYKNIRKLCMNIPHIHLSGTAIVESPCSIYHQMNISRFSPFRQFVNFYRFHDRYGVKYYIKAQGRDIAQYDRYKPELLEVINEFTVYMTQEDAGISKDLQAVDKLHYVTLNDSTKMLYNELQEHQIHWVAPDMFTVGMQYTPESVKYDLVCDSVMKLRTSLHMLESGVAKVDEQYLLLGNTEKVDYIKQTFGDSEGVGIMCHFVGEQMLLKKHFKKAKIYSSNSHAEGVDLSHLKHFIILSSDYKGSKFIQRRERIINTEGSESLEVHHILVKGAVSEQVYKKVSKKEDFNNSTYERTAL
jgi:hypothetical protein